MKEKKIYGIIIIIICALSVSAGTIKEGEKMTEYYWSYKAKGKVTVGAGSSIFNIKAPYQSTLKILYIAFDSSSGDNSGGTSETKAVVTIAGDEANVYLANTAGSVFLPNEDDIKTFGCLNIKDLIIYGSNFLEFARTYKAIDGEDYIYILGIVSTYGLPRITYIGGTIGEITEYTNTITGVCHG